MSIQEIVSILINSGIEPTEANIEVKMMIEEFCNYTALDIIKGTPLDYKKLEIVKEKAILRAKTRIPIQYIIGSAYFMGNKYIVNENVLIPRGETEQVVEKAYEIIKSNNYKKVLDIGTGSGCIACTLAQRGLEVMGVDISEKALEIAQQNAKNIGVDVKFLLSDIYSNIENEKFDLIISNPPYIPEGTELQKEVTFEPKSALYAKDNGLEFYRRIIESAYKYLNPDGHIVFEIGYDQGESVPQILNNNGFKNINVEKDLMGNDRIVYGQMAL